jgi:tripartite-type tricarboxylate transporter receptor subunit TctC
MSRRFDAFSHRDTPMPRMIKAVAALILLSAIPLANLAKGAQAASSFDKSPGGAGQGYPTHAIRVIAPFAPGGGSDMMARLVAQKLTEAFRQQAIVENRAGAGGRVGTEIVARAAPDGYTLLLTGSGSIIFAPALYQKIAYDPQKDLAPITTVASSSCILVVHPNVPVHSVKQLIALARSKPGVLNYASSGSGTPAHLAAELFQATTKVKIAHVAYKGTGAGLISVVAGETDLMFSNMLGVTPFIVAARLRALAVTTLNRSTLFPDVPTVSESGLPGFETVTYYGVFAPAGTPADIVAQLNTALVKGLHAPDTRKRLEADGSELRTSTPEEFARVIKADTEKWTKVIRAAGIKPES